MLRHVAMLTFVEGVTDDDIDAIDEGLAGLPGAIHEIRSYSFGRDLRLGEGNHDYVVVGDFESPEDFSTYSTHPEHVRVLSTLIKPVLKDVVRIQFDI